MKNLLLLLRTPTRDQQNKNHRNMFNVRCKSENMNTLKQHSQDEQVLFHISDHSYLKNLAKNNNQ